MSVAPATLAGLLRVADLSAAQLDAVLELGDEMRQGPGWWSGMHADGTVACWFDEPPAWTAASFRAAARRLGMATVDLRPGGLPAGSRAIVAATSAHAALERLAGAAEVPVVNASTPDHHPCQALADLLTIRCRFGYLDGLRVAYVGEGGNVAHSLMEACAIAGMHVAVATPRGAEPDHDVTLDALALAAEHGGSVRIGHDARAAVALADVVYAPAGAIVDRALMTVAAPGAVLMSSLAREQIANRLPIAQALLHSVVADGANT